MTSAAPVTSLTPVDYLIMAVYFLSGRSLSPWITGLAFISANLGA